MRTKLIAYTSHKIPGTRNLSQHQLLAQLQASVQQSRSIFSRISPVHLSDLCFSCCYVMLSVRVTFYMPYDTFLRCKVLV